MTSTELAAVCGVSQRQIYNLKTKFPSEVPASFNDTDGWKKFVDAHRVVVAAKRHAPRSNPDVQTDHARYVRARADRPKVWLRLSASAWNYRGAALFHAFKSRPSSVGSLQLYERLLRMLNDLPTALLGLNEADIHRVMSEKLEHATRDLRLSDDFLT
jgi:hypothetical protein